MSYRLEQYESVGDGVRRVAREQVDKALAEIGDGELGRHETVHQVRKRCKKIRGLVRLVRPRFEETYRRENAHYRDAARTLSDLRDAEAVLETVDGLEERFGDQVRPDVFAAVREPLEAERRRLADDEQDPKHDLEQRLADFADRLREGRERIAGWDLGEPEDRLGFSLVAGGLGKTYRRARKRMADAWSSPSSEAFHEWRKRVKYHRYHLRLLTPIWPKVTKARYKETKRLSDLLGDDHDLAVLRATLEEEGGGAADERAALIALSRRRSAELRAQAWSLGRRLFVEEQERYAARMRALIEIRNEECPR